eukprot:gene13967-biopygen5072
MVYLESPSTGVQVPGTTDVGSDRVCRGGGWSVARGEGVWGVLMYAPTHSCEELTRPGGALLPTRFIMRVGTDPRAQKFAAGHHIGSKLWAGQRRLQVNQRSQCWLFAPPPPITGGEQLVAKLSPAGHDIRGIRCPAKDLVHVRKSATLRCTHLVRILCCCW